MNNTWPAFFEKENGQDRLRWFDIQNETNLINDPLEFFGFELKVDGNYSKNITELKKRLDDDIVKTKKLYDDYIARFNAVILTASTADDKELVLSDPNLGIK